MLIDKTWAEQMRTGTTEVDLKHNMTDHLKNWTIGFSDGHYRYFNYLTKQERYTDLQLIKVVNYTNRIHTDDNEVSREVILLDKYGWNS